MGTTNGGARDRHAWSNSRSAGRILACTRPEVNMPDTLQRNKDNVVAFYDSMFNQCRPREAIERYAGAAYIQHNPAVADGKVVEALGRAAGRAGRVAQRQHDVLRPGACACLSVASMLGWYL
jgi:hypothetical protein